MPKSSLPAKTRFIPKNPQKYLGNNLDKITLRSNWERKMAEYFDINPMVLGWMSECVPSNHAGNGRITYQHPLRITKNGLREWTFYVPDFFVIYVDKTGKQHAEVIEVKPIEEVPPMISGLMGLKVSKLTESRRIINAAKFEAALKYCAQHGFSFRICTERDMYSFSPKSTNK